MVRRIGMVMMALWLGLVAVRAAEPKPFDDMAAYLGRLLGEHYFDARRFRPDEVVREALRSLEAGDVAIKTTWSGATIDLNIAGDHRSVAAPAPADFAAAMAILDRVRANLAHPRFDAERQRYLEYLLINGALRTLDPHTLVMPPEPADEFAEGIEGEFTGIGAYLEADEGLIRIQRVMAGLPADQAGLEDGDVILAVDGESTVGLNLGQAVRRIRGPAGTTVVLSIERGGHDEPLPISIVRDRVPMVVLNSYLDGDGIGYILLEEFNRNTYKLLLAELLQLQRHGALRGLVLDLRSNHGGLLDQAKKVCDLFLPKQAEIVRTVSPSHSGRPHLASGEMLVDVPMAVLVSGSSASAAEILAGALQVNDRAVVVGETSYGKGSVQTLTRLKDDSQLKFTIQGWQLRDGVSIQEHGVEPDLILERHTVDEDGRVDLMPYSRLREGDHEWALTDHGTYQHEVTYRLPWLRAFRTRDQRRAHHIANPDFTPDQEGRLAMELVAAAVGTLDEEQIRAGRLAGAMRQQLLVALRKPVAARFEAEAERLSAALAEGHALVWGAAGRPDGERLALAYNGPDMVTAGSEALLDFTLSNHSQVAVGRLYGLVRADRGSPFWESEVLFGEVAAGAEVRGTMAVELSPRAIDGEERFVVELYQDGSDEVLAQIPVSVRVAGRPLPSLSYSWAIDGGDQTLTLDQPDSLTLTITNNGQGDSLPLVAYLFKDDDHFVDIEAGRFVLDPIASGATAELVVPFT
ncbi:MAG: S41 family peptidase, partial [Planctomycetota bacterium]